ncbi:MAG: hypothetical protein RM021_019910 [Nostoc sp. EkiNYC01]|nr:hypothetical protein [Nostoc sp. EkiNYC01]
MQFYPQVFRQFSFSVVIILKLAYCISCNTFRLSFYQLNLSFLPEKSHTIQVSITMNFKSYFPQQVMISSIKSKSFQQKINKFSLIGLLVCSTLTTSLVIPQSSYANSVSNDSDDVVQTKQRSKYRGSYAQFKYRLGQRETGEQNPSYNNTKNPLGFLGKYQFGEALLIDLGYYQANVYYGKGADRNYWRGRWTGKGGVNSKQDFLNNKNAQERAIDEAFALQWRRLNAELQQHGRSVQQYLGKRTRTRGIVITPSGLLAASHLRGPRAAAEMLLFDRDSRDERGTSIFDYLSEFGGYQVR